MEKKKEIKGLAEDSVVAARAPFGHSLAQIILKP
jgi:hypothetical protein